MITRNGVVATIGAWVLTMTAWVATTSVAMAGDTPEWYDGSRVHIHTRYNPDVKLDPNHTQYNPTEFWGFEAEIERMGPRVISRWILGRDGDPWWPTAIGVPHPLVSMHGDVAQQLIDEAHSRNQYSVLYFRHQEDAWATAAHPDWVAKNKNGTDAQAQWGPWMSIASPYSEDFVVERVKELAQKGVDGLYFDWKHAPDSGDFNQFAQDKYAAWYGGDLLTASSAEVDKFRIRLQKEHFERIDAAFRAINPDGVTIVSINRMSLDALRSATAPKYEESFNGWLGGLESTATILTDIGGGYPHLWRNPETEDPSDEIARYLTYGTIYNRDIREGQEYDIPHNLWPSYGDLFNLNDEISPAMANVRPYRHARVVVNGTFTIRSTSLNTNIASAWNTLNDDGVPTGYISFEQVGVYEIPSETRVLVYPVTERSALTQNTGPVWQAMAAAIAQFEANGGLVIFKSDINAGNLVSMARQQGVPIEVTSTGGAAKRMVPYIKMTEVNGEQVDGPDLVVNVAGDNTSGVVVTLSDQYFSEPASIIESVSGQALSATAVTGGWSVALPVIDDMRQLDVSFDPPPPPQPGIEYYVTSVEAEEQVSTNIRLGWTGSLGDMHMTSDAGVDAQFIVTDIGGNNVYIQKVDGVNPRVRLGNATNPLTSVKLLSTNNTSENVEWQFVQRPDGYFEIVSNRLDDAVKKLAVDAMIQNPIMVPATTMTPEVRWRFVEVP